ncbi:hypothetical protein Ga0074812_106124 [Parafrankia irregularis]|uniref:Uncharacterized protein n=1 Tax=Parafrankia irregularis TaxID=795642 RepID=A0A0S4QKP9_9ACTN|nr:hypothetical protein Ga0074812_106124 [Parafrankia irregularis]
MCRGGLSVLTQLFSPGSGALSGIGAGAIRGPGGCYPGTEPEPGGRSRSMQVSLQVHTGRPASSVIRMS